MYCFRCQMILVSPVDKTLERISIYGFLRRSLAHRHFLPLPWAQIHQSIIVLASVLLLLLITLLRWLERPKIAHASAVKLRLLLLWLVKGALGGSWLELCLPLRLLLHCLLGTILLAHARAHPKLLVLLLLDHVAVEELGSEATWSGRLLHLLLHLHLLWLLHWLWLSPHVIHALVWLLLLPLLLSEVTHCIKGVVFIGAWRCVRVLIVHTQHAGEVCCLGLLLRLLLLLAIHLLAPSKGTSWLDILWLGLPRKITEAIVLLLRGWLEGIETEVSGSGWVEIDQIVMFLLWSQVSRRLWLLDHGLCWSCCCSLCLSFCWATSPRRLRIFFILTLSLRKLFLDPPIELASFLFEHGHWVILHVLVYPLPVDVLVVQESLNLERGSIRPWLGVARWKIGLPVGVSKIVRECLHELNFAIRPFVQVHWLDLGDVSAELAMLS